MNGESSTNPVDSSPIPNWDLPQGPPVDEPRSEDVHDLQLGTVVQDATGRNWVFFGWRQNSAGGSAYFVMEEKGFRQGDSHVYSAAIASTLEKKFPALVSMRKV